MNVSNSDYLWSTQTVAPFYVVFSFSVTSVPVKIRSSIFHCVWIELLTLAVTIKARNGHEQVYLHTVKEQFPWMRVIILGFGLSFLFPRFGSGVLENCSKTLENFWICISLLKWEIKCYIHDEEQVKVYFCLFNVKFAFYYWTGKKVFNGKVASIPICNM